MGVADFTGQPAVFIPNKWPISPKYPSVNETYWPIPEISIGSPSTFPPASMTFDIAFLMSSTAITTEGY